MILGISHNDPIITTRIDRYIHAQHFGKSHSYSNFVYERIIIIPVNVVNV